MRAKPSSTASETDRRSGTLASLPPIHGVAPSIADDDAHCTTAPLPGENAARRAGRRSRASKEKDRQEGLLHDARNLMGAIGLYCDLLSMPGVLQPEHRLYAEELRLLGARSGALIQHLMEQRMPSSFVREGSSEGPGAGAAWETGMARSLALAKVRAAGGGPVKSTVHASGPVSLGAILKRCLGLLSRVADDRVIEVSYGDAASLQLPVSAETVERILVNLVSNSAAAMRGPAGRGGDGKGRAAQSTVLGKREDRPADETQGSIRIGVGAMINRVQDPRPWPLRRMRLTVEDSGCGMTAEEMERILSVTRAPSRGKHGIGFRVVRDLVAASGGDLRVMSELGIGTRVQIEWPVTAMAQEKAAGTSSVLRRASASGQLAASCGLPARVRRAAHATGSLGATGACTVLRTGGDCARGDGRGTIC
jgi:signal transduction histidine kinase